MRKILTFGNYSAELFIDNVGAFLAMDENRLPLKLADTLNSADGINVALVEMNDGCGCIHLTYDIPASDLLAEVCDAITRVYDTDMTVLNARP